MKKFVDLHCDTIVKCYECKNNLLENNLHIDIKRMKKAHSFLQFFAIWLWEETYSNFFETTLEIIDFYYSELEKNKEHIKHINSFNDIDENKINSILSIEGGEILDGKIENLHTLYNKGVRAITLTWNYENQLGHGADCEKGGLHDFGKEVIKECEKLNIIVDVSHLNEESFWDTYRHTNKPFIASHSNAKEITNIKRNLTDKQIKAIVEKEGIIGINFYPEFLMSTSPSVTTDEIIKHIDYIIKLVGYKNLSFGCDFDGVDRLPKGISGIESIGNIGNIVYKKYGDTIGDSIFYENFLNFYKKF